MKLTLKESTVDKHSVDKHNLPTSMPAMASIRLVCGMGIKFVVG